MKRILTIIAILSGLSCSAQITYIGGTSAGSSAGTSATTPTMNTTAANYIKVFVPDYQPIAVCLVTDSKANTWILDTSVNDGTLTRGRTFHCAPCIVGGAHSFTIGSGCGTATFPSIIVGAWSGVSTSSSEGVRTGAGLASATSGQGGSITPGQANSLVITCVSENGTTTAPTIPSGYTSVATVGQVASQHLGGGMAYKLQTTPAAENPTWSYPTSKATVLNEAINPAVTTITNNFSPLAQE